MKRKFYIPKSAIHDRGGKYVAIRIRNSAIFINQLLITQKMQSGVQGEIDIDEPILKVIKTKRGILRTVVTGMLVTNLFPIYKKPRS